MGRGDGPLESERTGGFFLWFLFKQKESGKVFLLLTKGCQLYGGVAMLSAAGDGNEGQARSELNGGARVEVGTWTHSKGGELSDQKQNFDGDLGLVKKEKT